MRLVECVPNFSEGRSQKVIDAIAETIRSVEGATLLDVDPGKSTNRTVYTFVGSPEAASEAAFQAIARGSTLIDMRQHHGAHPRMGACDVCPFIPISDITMEECAELARQLGKRVGAELGIPVYLYAEAAAVPERRNLADVRSGEYEGLADRMHKGFKPDFGPVDFNAQSGATVIGARPFLIAYNVNINSRSQKLANEIALSIREGGRAKRDEAGNIVKDSAGQTVKLPGLLKACKAVGWYVDEYEQAQISINLVDFEQTSVEHAFDECVRQGDRLGVRITGSEIVGMVPLEPMLRAGKHYLKKQGRCTGVPESELVKTAILSLGLNDVAKFDSSKKIIEYAIAPSGQERLLKNMTLTGFADELSSESPAPGGGSVAALCGSLSAALAAMVANLTFGKKGYEHLNGTMDELSVKAQSLKKAFLNAIDEDTAAFNKIGEARRLPKDTDAAKAARLQALEEATKQATLVPFSVLTRTLEAVELAEQLVEKGNPNTLSDAGVAGSTARAACEGALYNVLINLKDISDETFRTDLLRRAEKTAEEVRQRTEKIHSRLVETLTDSLKTPH